MSELRVNGKSEDGLYLTLLDGDGKEFSVRISDTLRSTVNQPRLMSVQDEEAAPISVKEIQRRLRTGESSESIAQDGNITVEKVERFSGPILQERQFIIDQAATVIVRKEPGREPVDFGDAIVLRLAPRGVDITQINYNCWRIETGIWTIKVSYPTSDGQGVGQWEYDPTRRALNALDDNAQALYDGFKKDGFILPEVDVDPNLVLEYLVPLVEPLRTPTFKYSRDWLRDQSARVGDPRNPTAKIGFQLNLPAEYVLIHRVTMGTTGIFCQLEAEGPFRDEALVWFPEIAPVA
mgnify:FL=1